MRSSVTVTVCLGLLSSCAAEPGDSGPHTTDSAGVRIVNNVTATWTAETAWRLAPTPDLEIGLSTDDAAYELFDVRGAVRLSDGRIVVANSGTRQVRYYDPSGLHLADVGGTGGGPGEFRDVGWLGRIPGDSIAVYDRRQRRLTIFGPRGAHVRDIPLTRPRGPLPILGTATDGSFFAQRNVRLDVENLPGGMARDSVALLRIESDGGRHDTIRVFSHRNVDIKMREVDGRRRRIPAPLLFSDRSVIALLPDGFAVGNTSARSFGIYDRAGVLQTVARAPFEPVAATEADRRYVTDSVKVRFAANLRGPEVALFISNIEESVLPEYFPAYDSLLTDPEENVWMRSYRRPGAIETVWDVFGPDGQLLGRVTGPDRFRATEIGPDYVLGIAAAADGTERVQRYPLVKP